MKTLVHACTDTFSPTALCVILCKQPLCSHVELVSTVKVLFFWMNHPQQINDEISNVSVSVQESCQMFGQTNTLYQEGLIC